MPRIIRLYLKAIAVGFGVAALFTALLLWWDVGGLGRLIAGSDRGALATFLLWFFNGIVFTGVQVVWILSQMAGGNED
ncbi:hypothetical protein ACK8OR_00035 [Jannaschia sp. KMU-145]|uniref:hypothetical protein n=1 Tax=Jannaschia halovivens TaxID=3388667 RepID=UPI00396B3476